ncbi:MAG: BNR-4 repeat-containing protein [Candidatus Altiarchaeia archaeon]
MSSADYVPSGSNVSVAVDSGAWCWFQDPRVVNYAGVHNRTYIGSVDRNGSIVITQYDHVSKDFSSYTLHYALQRDDHNSATVYVRPDGRLIAFYSKHAGDSLILYRISSYPEDVSSWGEEKNFSGTSSTTYSYPVYLAGEGKIYLFYRKGNCFIGQIMVRISTDNGTSWGNEILLTNIGNGYPYPKIVGDGVSKIYFGMTGSHPADIIGTKNIYFAYYQNGFFYKANGSAIKSWSSLPLYESDMEMVYNSTEPGHYFAWMWDAAYDSGGNPYIVFSSFPNATRNPDNLSFYTPPYQTHHYNYARWTGLSWEVHDITTGGPYLYADQSFYSGGMSLDKRDPNIVYLSRKYDVREIERWVAADGGSSWVSEPITIDSEKDNIRPVVPFGPALGDVEVLWMSGDFPSFTNYYTSIKMLSQRIGLNSSCAAPLTGTSSGVQMRFAAVGQKDDCFHLDCYLSGRTAWTSGRYGSGLSFDGANDYAVCGNGSRLDIYDAFTVSAWVKRGSNSSRDWVLTKGANVSTGGIMHFGFRQNDVFSFAFWGDDLDASAEYSDLAWHHWVGVLRSNLTREIWRDGVKVAEDVALGVPDMNGKHLYIGTRKDYIGSSSSDFFDGVIDEVMFYNRSLSSSEISALYGNGSVNGGLVGHWKFDEGLGSFAEDFSQNSSWANWQPYSAAAFSASLSGAGGSKTCVQFRNGSQAGPKCEALTALRVYPATPSVVSCGSNDSVVIQGQGILLRQNVSPSVYPPSRAWFQLNHSVNYSSSGSSVNSFWRVLNTSSMLGNYSLRCWVNDTQNSCAYKDDLSFVVVAATTTSTTTTTSSSSTMSSTTTTTSSTSSSSTSSTIFPCVMPGNDLPCSEVTLAEVVNAINMWVSSSLDLGEVVDLIDSWADPAAYPPN